MWEMKTNKSNISNSSQIRQKFIENIDCWVTCFLTNTTGSNMIPIQKIDAAEFRRVAIRNGA